MVQESRNNPSLRVVPSWHPSSTFLALLAGFLGCAVWMIAIPDHERWLVFPFVLIGFLIGVCLHEFGHAIIAYYCGDTTVREKGYLTLDPLQYTDVVYSIIFPLLIMAIGGIGLPGGAVYINHHLLRRRVDGALVSAGGPLATAAVLAVLMIVLNFMTPTGPYRILYASLAFLALLKVTALVFNLIPCPGLDGWGIIEPFLPATICSGTPSMQSPRWSVSTPGWHRSDSSCSSFGAENAYPALNCSAIQSALCVRQQ